MISWFLVCLFEWQICNSCGNKGNKRYHCRLQMGKEKVDNKCKSHPRTNSTFNWIFLSPSINRCSGLRPHSLVTTLLLIPNTSPIPRCFQILHRFHEVAWLFANCWNHETSTCTRASFQSCRSGWLNLLSWRWQPLSSGGLFYQCCWSLTAAALCWMILKPECQISRPKN